MTAIVALAGFRRLASLTLLLTFLLIVIGATVRVFDAGMACPDWPACYGQWIPFPVPEGSPYSTFQVLLEWGHRFLAMIVGFCLIGLLVLAVRHRKENRRVFKLTVLSAVVLAIQIKLGGVTVWLSNENWTVALHLGNAMIFYGALLLTLMAASRAPDSKGLAVSQRGRAALWAFLGLVYLTMLMGAMVSSSHAGAACGGLFSCEGSWLPTADMLQLLHMKHRYLAALTILAAAAVFVLSFAEGREYRVSARVLVGALAFQVLVGVVLLYSFSHYGQYYQALSVFHLAWGTVLFTMALSAVAKTAIGAKGTNAAGVPWH
jgi:heme A synthase